MNSLLGILLRFRREQTAVMGDVEQMFHSFHVNKEHRDYLRFFWFKDDPTKPVIQYRMNVHLFGNVSSPAIATFGLRKIAEDGVSTYGEDVKEFIDKNFYVDDGLTSAPDAQKAISLVNRTRDLLATRNVNFHKIVSNDEEVMTALPNEVRAKDLQSLDFNQDTLPTQRSLGVKWSLEADAFTFEVDLKEKPFSWRGVLAIVNSIYGPLAYTHALTYLSSVPAVDQHEDNVNVSFILGKAKVNPTHAVSIPRLELCAAVLATELAQKITSEIGLNIDNVIYHTDSEIVLGYINNSSKRFHVYVANRVEKIHNISSPHQWRHVSTHENPADIASRSIPAPKLNSTIWLSGPAFLWQRDEQDNHEETEHKYTVSDEDPEVRKQLAVLNTSTKEVEQDDLGAHRFQRFSSWRSLKRSIANLIGKIRQRKSPEKTDKKEKEKSPEELKIEMMAQAETIILRSVQKSVFHKEYEILSAAKSAGADNSKLQKQNPISRMNPFIDEKGLIRVGGRLRQSDLDLCGRHPIILPQDNHISRLIIDHVHRQVQHQGRQLTLSNVRANGYWIMGVHDMVRSILHKCAICRRLRAKPLTQLMADLPSDRTEKTPPFTNVGMDVFGPWTIASRKTRAGTSEAKRLAVIFVCLYTTAVHIEVIDSMDSSSFINALRRFIAIRGNIKKLRCDHAGHQLHRRKERTSGSSQRAGSRPHQEIPYNERLRLDFQPTSRITLRRYMGTTNWYHQTRS
ncbi:uncharacterized protein [Ptychodera flava]|uniref:uncharacterized protein n=1 Tax=Ptychodera flava TaxID=63121 RepID=UPI00396A64E1